MVVAGAKLLDGAAIGVCELTMGGFVREISAADGLEGEASTGRLGVPSCEPRGVTD